MKIDIHDGVFDLQPGQLLKLEAAAGTGIQCVAGVLWITQEGRARDEFLCAGQGLAVNANGRTVVEAMGGLAARIRLRAPARDSHAHGMLGARPVC